MYNGKCRGSDRISEVIMGAVSLTMLVASLLMLWQSIRKREVFISEEAWDRLAERAHVLRKVFALSFLSLMIYLFAESAELLNLDSPSATLAGVHEIGELVHMFIFVIAVLLITPLFSAMSGGKDGI